MKFCMNHWEELKNAIKERGMWNLVAIDGHAAIYRTKQELEGTATDSTYDPLMAANFMISGKALEMGGLYLLSGNYCPLCELELNKPTDSEEYEKNWATIWIQECTDSILNYCKERKLLEYE